jgi:hypothetical protein
LLVRRGGISMDRFRILEIKAAHRRLSGRPPAQRAPVDDRVFFSRTAGAMEADAGRGPVDRRRRAAVIAHPERMAFAAVLVPIAVARRFPAPAQVVVIGLVPLRGHRELRLFTGDFPIPRGQRTVAGEDRRRLFVQALRMEQAVVPAQARVRQPWHQHSLKERDAAIRSDQLERGDITGKRTQAAVSLYQRDAQQLAVHRLKFYRGIVAQDFHLEFEVARQVFRAFEPVDHQLGLRAVILGERQAQQAGTLVGFQQRLQVSHRFAHL